jgi:tellurium resistance protein TerD
MTDEEIKALGRELDRKYKEISEQGKREQEEREARMKTEIRCPKCGSNQLAAGSKGFGLGKAAAGGLLLGPVGLLSGFIGSGQVTLSCLRCGNRWKAGM